LFLIFTKGCVFQRADQFEQLGQTGNDRDKYSYNNVVRSCPPPFVDGLIVIPHHHHVSVVPGQKFDQLLLAVVDILVLVYNHKAQVSTPALIGVGIAFQDIDCHGDEVIKGQGKSRQTLLLELRKHQW